MPIKKRYAWESLISDSDDEQITKSSERTDPLAEVRELYSNTFVLLEVTLNFPRTPGFRNMTSDKQKNLYNKIWNKIICFKGMDNVDMVHTRHVYELCKSGHVHLHGALYVKVGDNYYVEGLIADLVKTYLRLLPRVYAQYNDHCMYSEHQRYRSPSICVQHTLLTDLERVAHWETYIDKNSNKK